MTLKAEEEVKAAKEKVRQARRPISAPLLSLRGEGLSR
jgi:hypothetical protein